MHKLFFKVGEALVAYKVLLTGKGNKVGALALVAEELSVLSSRELNKAGEVVFAVKLEEWLEGWQTVEVECLSRLKVLGFSGLSFEDNLVLLVTWAECGQSGSRSRNSEVSGVAKVVLRLGKGGGWQG